MFPLQKTKERLRPPGSTVRWSAGRFQSHSRRALLEPVVRSSALIGFPAQDTRYAARVNVQLSPARPRKDKRRRLITLEVRAQANVEALQRFLPLFHIRNDTESIATGELGSSVALLNNCGCCACKHHLCLHPCSCKTRLVLGAAGFCQVDASPTSASPPL